MSRKFISSIISPHQAFHKCPPRKVFGITSCRFTTCELQQQQQEADAVAASPAAAHRLATLRLVRQKPRSSLGRSKRNYPVTGRLSPGPRTSLHVMDPQPFSSDEMLKCEQMRKEDTKSRSLILRRILKFSSHSCTICTKRFATQSALQRHLRERHAATESGDVPRSRSHLSEKPFTSQDPKTDGESLSKRGPQSAETPCPVCGEQMSDDISLSQHLAKSLVNHDNHARYREMEVSEESLRSRGFFSGMSVVSEQSIFHDTHLHTKHAVVASGHVLRPAPGESPVHQGPLAMDNAPECSYFSLTNEHTGSIPWLCSFPQSSEPGEECAKLILNLHKLQEQSDVFKLFFIGAYLTPFSPTWKSNASVVLLLVRNDEHLHFAMHHGTELDLNENPILRLNRATSQWEMATRAGTPSQLDNRRGWRPIRIVVATCGDIELTNLQPIWRKTFRTQTHSENFLVCPVCDVPHQRQHLVDHMRVVHEMGTPPLFRCDECAETSPYKRNILRHKRDVHGHASRGVRFSCDLCDRTYKQRTSLRRHRKTAHGDVPLYDASTSNASPEERELEVLRQQSMRRDVADAQNAEQEQNSHCA